MVGGGTCGCGVAAGVAVGALAGAGAGSAAKRGRQNALTPRVRKMRFMEGMGVEL